MNGQTNLDVLLISEEGDDFQFIRSCLDSKEIAVKLASSAAAALKMIEKDYPKIVILSNTANIPPAVLAVKVHGAFPSIDIIGLGFDSDIVGFLFNITRHESHELAGLRVNKAIRDHLALIKCGLVGRSPSIKEVANAILSGAPTDLSILLTGPSGVGKEVAARAIHNNSKRGGNQFYSVNCGALTEGVLSSELFGHERGAFTGAVSQKSGVFESAGDGTIFLDEIGEISPETQVKLLRVLEDGSFYRVGGNKMLKSKARIIAATNRDLFAEVSSGRFRQDLYYRLRVVEIRISSLRERQEDIAALAEKFVSDLGIEFHQAIAPEVIDIMARHDWPGNGRELRNFVESRIALSADKIITRTDVENYIRDSGYERRHLPMVTGISPETAERQVILQAIMGLRNEISALKELITDNLPKAHDGILGRTEVRAEWRPESPIEWESEVVKPVDDLEKEAIIAALRKFRGNRRKAARALGVGERTLYRKIAKYGLHLN